MVDDALYEELAKGWKWVQYEDGCGYILSPDHHKYMEYDMQTNEYKIDEYSCWLPISSLPEGEDFFEHATEYAYKYLIEKETKMQGGKLMEKKYKHNSVEITGNISSIGEIKTKTNGNEFMYINIAQNSRDGKASFYPVYLDGVMLENFNNKDLKVGDRITAIGKLESYQKDNKQTLQIRPFEIQKVEYENIKNNSQTIKNESTKEVSI